MTNIQACVNDLLYRGLDDLNDTTDVVSIAILVGGVLTQIEKQQMSLEIIRHAVMSGLVEIGELRRQDFRFQKWDLPNQLAFSKLEEEWLSLGRLPDPYEIGLLRNSALGNEVAKDLDQKINRGVKGVLIRGIDGMIDLSEVASIAKSVVGETTEDEIRWFSALMIHEVTRHNLMDIGDLQGAGDFCKWDVMDFEDEPREHVQKVWRELGRNPIPGEICCLRITSKGREMAEELKRQRQSET